MAVLKAILSKALDYATDHPGLTQEQIKKIRMTNLACGAQALNLTSLIFILHAFDVSGYFPVYVMEVIALFVCLWLEGRGRFTLAKTVLYISILFSVVIACAGFDEKLQVIVFGFPVTIAIFLLYGREEARIMYTMVVISVITLAASTLISAFIEPFYLVTPNPILASVITCQALILSVLIVKGFFDESYRSEQKYIEAAHTISEQKERLQTVFDIVEEMILVVGEGGRIQDGFSKYTKSIIHRPDVDIIGQNAFDLLFSAAHHDRDEIDQYRSALEMALGAHELQWDVNSDKILRELEFTFAGQRSVLVLNWQPIVRDGLIVSLLLMARDITLHRLHDRIKSEQQERTQILMGIVAAIMKSSRQLVENFFAKALQKMRDLDSGDTEGVLFELHTLKGVARSLGLQDIATRIHAIETAMQTAKPGEITGKLDALEHFLESSLQMVHEIAGASSSTYRIAFQNLYDVASQTRMNLYHLLEKYQLELDYFLVDDGVLGWNSGALEIVSEALQHAMTNAIDHGFVFPRMRNQITAPQVQLLLKAWHEPRATIIELTDNGNGIEDKALQALAHKYGLDLAAYQNPLDILFESGVSTTSTLSLTSGRGVGTSAVRAAAAKLKGTASMRRNPQRGLTLRLELPRETSLYSTTVQSLRKIGEGF